MAMITGGSVIWGGQTMPDTKPRVTYIENAVPTDALVAGSTGRTPANGELAVNVTTGNVYERQAGLWVRVDTL